jgi:hypothetical protein
MPTRSEFVTWLESRRSAGESLASIARGFGVSAVTVMLWLDGKRNPSRMALVLAGLLAPCCKHLHSSESTANPRLSCCVAQ